MTYNYVLGVKNKSVKTKMSTKQFELSEVILDKRFELNLEYEEIIKIVDMTLNEYINLEFGDSDISLDKYEDALQKIYEYEIKEKEEQEIDLVNFEDVILKEINSSNKLNDESFYENNKDKLNQSIKSNSTFNVDRNNILLEVA